jgi:putative oxidoreductase
VGRHRRRRPTAASPNEGTAVARKSKTGRRRTPGADAAALLLRLTLGPMLAYHGYNKIAGEGGLEGTTGWFDSLGLQPAHVHARLAAATEIASGVGFTLGVFMPAPAAATIGLMTVAARTDHKGKGFFVFKGGWEYTGVVSGAALALAALGPGRWSLDAALGANRRGLRWAFVAAALGAGGALGLLKTSYRPNAPTPEPDLEP